MKKLIRLYIKIASVLVCLVLLLALLTPVFIPKYGGTFGTTAVMDGFYELEENSIDVLFLGSSQIMTSISPVRIYEKTGISSYNMGTEQQNMVLSYYLLKEALRFQSPRIVVLDVFFLFPYNGNPSPLNSNEEFVRKPIDYMKWSSNKWETIRTVCSLDTDHDIKSYLFPFLRFHSRWNDLTLEDFTYLFKNKENTLMGFSINKVIAPQSFQGFVPGSSSLTEELPETMRIYFEKIISLCKEENITLVLIKTPRGDGSFGEVRHNTVKNLADENGLVFLDFNEKSLMEEIHFDASNDYMDFSHINLYGAEKISDYLACYLSGQISR